MVLKIVVVVVVVVVIAPADVIFVLVDTKSMILLCLSLLFQSSLRCYALRF